MLRVELCRFPRSIHHSPKQQTVKDDLCLMRTLWLWAKSLTLLGLCVCLSRTINLPSFLTWLPPSPIPQAHHACRMQQQRLITPEGCQAHWTESHISKEERVGQKKRPSYIKPSELFWSHSQALLWTGHKTKCLCSNVETSKSGGKPNVCKSPLQKQTSPHSCVNPHNPPGEQSFSTYTGLRSRFPSNSEPMLLLPLCSTTQQPWG